MGGTGRRDEPEADPVTALHTVFTKCKDNLHNGRRLENLSWRLWFDTTRREELWLQQQRSLDSDAVDVARINDDDEDDVLSDPEDGGDWTESSAADSDIDRDSDCDAAARPSALAATAATPRRRTPDRDRRRAGSAGAAQQSCPRGLTPAAAAVKPRSTSTGGTHEGRPTLLARPDGARTTSTISGGSIQRIISSLPPINLPFKSHSVVEPTPSPLLSPGAQAGITSRHSSAPDALEPAPIAQLHPPSPSKAAETAVNKSLAAAVLPDARVTTSPAPILKRSPSRVEANPMTRTSSQQSASTSERHVRLAAQPASVKGHARRISSPRPPPPTPATSVSVTSKSPRDIVQPPSSASATHLQPQSSVKGFDTTAYENRPRPGSIAPPPTPAVALAQLPSSPPKRAPSALKGSVASTSATQKTPNGTAAGRKRAAGGGTGKKIFFISSPTSDSEDDGASSSRSARSRGSDWQAMHAGYQSAHGKRSSLSESVKAGDVGVHANSQPNPAPTGDDEWDDDDDDEETSGWGSEYSSGSEARASRDGHKSAQKDDDHTGMFAKRPSVIFSGQPGELKPRPPGLLSQLFHPDLFLDDADRRHSLVDVRRANGAPPSESLSGISSREALSSRDSPAQSRTSRLQTSKSTGVLGDAVMRRTSRSRSFLKGRPDHVELESSSDESDYEDVESSQDAETLRRQQQQQHGLAERLRMEQMTAAPIAPPQTPRTTRRAMLATELSESLRRNLLWERQQRTRVMGGPPHRFVLPSQQHQQQQQQQQHPAHGVARQYTAPPAPQQHQVAQSRNGPPPPGSTKSDPATASTVSDGVGPGTMAPYPSPATRQSSPMGPPESSDAAAAVASGEMVRRHTTGAGLYLEGLAGETTRAGVVEARNSAEHVANGRSERSSSRRRGLSHGHVDAFGRARTMAGLGMTTGGGAATSGPARRAAGQDEDDDGSSSTYSSSSSDGERDGAAQRRLTQHQQQHPLAQRRKSTFSSVWGQKVW